MTTAPHGRASPSSVGLGGPQLRWADFGRVQTALAENLASTGSWRQEERAMVLVGTVVPLVNDSSRPCTTSSVVRTRGLQCTPWCQCLLLLDCTHVARGELLQSDCRGRGAWPWVTRAGCGYGDRQAPSSSAEKDVHVHIRWPLPYFYRRHKRYIYERTAASARSAPSAHAPVPWGSSHA